jgi:hypothetical protein
LRLGLSRNERDVWGGQEGFARAGVGRESCPDCIERGALRAHDGKPVSIALVASCETCGGTGGVRRRDIDPYMTPGALFG